MLQIKDIRKEYRTGSLVQQALDGVSLNFRDNEFVAILGPSGSGKTTLLNVVGGLDQYDSGDLIINGTSTKKYTDRDWDSYRNHTIGFVFQSYNLIPHQTVLQNVELALTIGGISKEERTRRASEALTAVGLGEQLHKKPTQMSGGQMQRVAIARALVNDPDILLADEPTGALDSETSVQVMELLKQVADDRLVIMVTHNPELAEEYATRIVKLKDGTIRSDSDPYIVDEAEEPEAEHRNLGKASMNFLTALSLSFNNMKTKRARTLLVSFAGSIGIIGIALILALSTGVNKYIADTEEDTLKEYPLTIEKASFDMTTFMQAGNNSSDKNSGSSDTDSKKETQVREAQMLTGMFSMMDSNDLKSLKKFIDKGNTGIEKHARAIEYNYDIVPHLYATEQGSEDSYRQVNPDTTMSKMGFNYGGSALYSKFMSSDVFHKLPEKKSLYEEQYDVKAGRWPKKYNEVVVVLTSRGSVSDLALYAMGKKDPSELDDMVKEFSKGNQVEITSKPGTYSYKDFIGTKFKLVGAYDTYSYNSQYDLWEDRSGDADFMNAVVSKGEDVEVVGVVQPKEGVKFTMLSNDIYYPTSMVDHMMDRAAQSDVVKAQLADPDRNVLTGKNFGEEGSNFDMGSLFQMDQSALANAFSFDASALSAGAGKGADFNIDPEALSAAVPGMTPDDIGAVLKDANIQVTDEQMEQLFGALMAGYLRQAAADPTTDFANIQSYIAEYLKSSEANAIVANDIKSILGAELQNKLTTAEVQAMVTRIMSGYGQYLKDNNITDITDETLANYLASADAQAKIATEQSGLLENISGILTSDASANRIATDLLAGYTVYAQTHEAPDPTKFGTGFTTYLQSEEAQGIIAAAIAQTADSDALNNAIAKRMGEYNVQMANAIASAISGAMAQQMQGMTADFSKMFKVDPSAFAAAFGGGMSDMDEKDLQTLMASLLTTGQVSYENNLSKFGYADKAEPTQIAIYAKSFEDKQSIKDILDAYNKRMKKAGEDDKVITYTDLVAALMSSVTDIINAISYILIAFVSISLVVSSIMIGVITYISVLERRKEIGILRAIGASKRNISQVFNAETFIIGGLAGVFGIIITLLLMIPGNYIIHHITGNTAISAYLPPQAAILLILLSIVLTLIGGIIPSRKAAKSDPVTALRVE